MTAPSRGGVQSVDRALDLLLCLATRGPSGVSELAGSTGLPLGTVHRLLASLADRGFARQGPDRRYAVGPAALSLVDASRDSIAAAGAPYTRRLATAYGESANLAVLQGGRMTYVAQTPSPHSLRIFAEVGRQVPLHSTAVGKAVLATYDDDAVVELLRHAPLRPTTPHTLTQLPRLLAELAAIRERGYAFDEQEQEIGVRCVAAAVPGTPTLAALSLSGPAERFSSAHAREAGQAVRDAASELSAALA